MKKINKIKIKLNGKYIKIQDKITLLNLVKKTKVSINKVAIELNKEIVNKDIFSSNSEGTYYYSNGWQIKSIY